MKSISAVELTKLIPNTKDIDVIGIDEGQFVSIVIHEGQVVSIVIDEGQFVSMLRQ